MKSFEQSSYETDVAMHEAGLEGVEVPSNFFDPEKKLLAELEERIGDERFERLANPSGFDQNGDIVGGVFKEFG